MHVSLKYLIPILLLSFLFISCEEDQLTGETTYEKALEPFNTVELNSVFEVYLIQDTVFSLKIVADADVISNIEYSVDEGVLRISDETQSKWLAPKSNKVKLYITSNRLYEILPNATCSITTLNPIISDEFRIVMGHSPKLSEINLTLACKSFLYWNNHQCGGKVTLSGQSDNIFLYAFALMSIDASQLGSQYAFVENNSKGDCQIRVSDMLEYSIRGVGDIYIHGNPAEVIMHDRTSSGELIHVE